MLSFKEIKELIDLVTERGLSGLEIERAGFRIRIEGARPPVANGTIEAPANAAPAPTPALGAAAVAAAPEGEGVHVITSPIVGTFYRAPSPEAEAFADVGSRVSKGKVLCIIESMKLMNEIESEIDAEVVEIRVANGQPVEYGEVLFRLRPVSA